MDHLLKISSLFLSCVIVFSCGRKPPEEKLEDTVIVTDTPSYRDTVAFIDEQPLPKPTVLVLPPFDVIANAGISPDIQKFLETELGKDSSLTVIPFPFKKLMNVQYYQVFDKKYCSPILEKVPADIIVMSKLDQHRHTGNMERDGWDVSFRIFNTQTNQQKNSTISIHNHAAEEIRKVLASRHTALVAEILHTTQAE